MEDGTSTPSLSPLYPNGWDSFLQEMESIPQLELEQVESAGGNTKTPASRQSQFLKWCFTLNNWSKEEYKRLCIVCTKMCRYWIIGKEIGDQGTPHLQGYIELKSKKRLDTIKKQFNERAHWERAKGTRMQNKKYCMKEGDWEDRGEEGFLKEKCLLEYADVSWKYWQQSILDLCESDTPSNRFIHWFWEPNGNTGKSYLAKYICLRFRGVIIAEGKSNDVFNQIKTMLDNLERPRIVILDIPRSSQEYLNYSMMEKCKNGLMYSGKYEGGKCIYPCPHMICFANQPPEYSKLSKDRWIIVELSEYSRPELQPNFTTDETLTQ